MTRAQGFALGMLGTPAEPELRLRAAETNGMLRFAAVAFERHGAVIVPARRELFGKGLKALLVVHDICHDRSRMVPPPSSAQKFTDAARQHLRSCVALGIRLRPKHHFLLHMGARLDTALSYVEQTCLLGLPPIAPSIHPPTHHRHRSLRRLLTHGAPFLGNCWADESANNDLRSTARGAHAAVWHARVLLSWAAAETIKRRRTAEHFASLVLQRAAPGSSDDPAGHKNTRQPGDCIICVKALWRMMWDIMCITLVAVPSHRLAARID